MKHLLPVLSVLALAACSSQPDVLPDGGRPRQICQNAPTAIPVTVQDLQGVPAGGATVHATNVSTGKTLDVVVGGDGRTGNKITDALGDGQVQLTAEQGSLKTKQAFIIQLVCGDCDCSAMPGSATLTVQ